MSIFKIEYDFEEFYLFHLDVSKVVRKMPSFRPRKVAVSLVDSWVMPEGSFYKGDNFQRASPAIPDITVWGLGYLVLSKKANDVLGGAMAKSGELLPIDIDGETFYLFNCTYVLPDRAVDKTNAVERIDIGVRAGSEGVVIDESVLGSRLVFRACFDNKVSLYCTNEFSQCLKAQGLSGLLLVKI